MKNFLSRITKLEELVQRKNKPVTSFVAEKEKVDPYYWSKMFELCTKEELQKFSEIEDNQESLELVESLVAKYDLQTRTRDLSPQSKSRIDSLNCRLNSLNQQQRQEILERKTDAAKKFWDELFKDHPLTTD